MTGVVGCAAAVVVCGRSRGRLVCGCGCMHCVGQAASGGACGRGCSACAKLRCVGKSAVSGRDGTGGAWPRLRAARSCLTVESASVWRAWPRLRAVRSCLRVESASVWRAWPRLRAVRSCLRVESASVWREGHARRHADRCRSAAIRRDRGAVKRHNYAIDPACRSTDSVIGCRSCQDGPPFWCLRGRLHIERVGYNMFTPATEPSNDCISLMVPRDRTRLRAPRTCCAILQKPPKSVYLSCCGAHAAGQTHGPVAKRAHLPPRIDFGRRTHRAP